MRAGISLECPSKTLSAAGEANFIGTPYRKMPPKQGLVGWFWGA
jgi:hypothetical protein